jgi:hypothetical protein
MTHPSLWPNPVAQTLCLKTLQIREFDASWCFRSHEPRRVMVRRMVIFGAQPLLAADSESARIGLAAQEREDGQDASMRLGAGIESEFPEDLLDVSFDGGVRDE